MHLSNEDVDAIAAGDDQPEPGGHLSTCDDCAGRVANARHLHEVLSDRETWAIVEEIDTGRRTLALQDLADQIRKEDEDAERLLGRLAASPYWFLWANLNIRKRRFRSGGVVRFLNRAAHEECERDPLHARNLADAAITVAEALPDDLYPASGVEHLRGVAWKERANACRYLGDLGGALSALDRAERAFRRLLTADHHFATVDLIRATALAEMERRDEAMSFAARAAGTFARLGDTRRWAHAQLVVGGILFYSEDYEAAHHTFAQILDVSATVDDDALEARVQHNVAICEIELGRFDAATVRLVAAITAFQKMQNATEVVRTRWSIGRLTLLAGNAGQGVRQLAAARDEAVALRLSDDAAKITLDLVKGLLAVGDTKRIPRLLSEAVRYFSEAGQPAAVVAATAYLREAVAANGLTADLVDFVRRFIARAERDANLVFTPPF